MSCNTEVAFSVQCHVSPKRLVIHDSRFSQLSGPQSISAYPRVICHSLCDVTSSLQEFSLTYFRLRAQWIIIVKTVLVLNVLNGVFPRIHTLTGCACVPRDASILAATITITLLSHTPQSQFYKPAPGSTRQKPCT